MMVMHKLIIRTSIMITKSLGKWQGNIHNLFIWLSGTDGSLHILNINSARYDKGLECDSNDDFLFILACVPCEALSQC
jgi:hypothetical protein